MSNKNNKKNKKAGGKKLSVKMIVLIIVCAVIGTSVLVVGGIHLYKRLKPADPLPEKPNSPAMEPEQGFLDGSDVFDEARYKINKKTDGNIQEIIEEIINRDEQMGAYQIVMRHKGEDKFFEVNYWTETGKGIYEYNFSGLNIGLDLSGVYYRTRIDGIDTIVDYYDPDHGKGEFITKGEFFDKHFGTLSGITLDNMLSEILDSGFVDVGTNESGDTVITSGDISICISNNENRDTRIIDKRADKVCGYYISYGKHYSMPIIEHHEKND